MKCSTCGSVLPENAKFCTKCGAPAGVQPEMQPLYEPQPHFKEPLPQQEPLTLYEEPPQESQPHFEEPLPQQEPLMLNEEPQQEPIPLVEPPLPLEQPPVQEESSKKGLVGKIIGLLISIGLIIGGLSGDYVLRGTESSTALVVFGCLFLVGDIISLATHNREPKQKKAREPKQKKIKKSSTTDYESVSGDSYMQEESNEPFYGDSNIQIGGYEPFSGDSNMQIGSEEPLASDMPVTSDNYLQMAASNVTHSSVSSMPESKIDIFNDDDINAICEICKLTAGMGVLNDSLVAETVRKTANNEAFLEGDVQLIMFCMKLFADMNDAILEYNPQQSHMIPYYLEYTNFLTHELSAYADSRGYHVSFDDGQWYDRFLAKN